MFLVTNIKLIQNYTIKRKKLGYFVDQLVYTIILGSNSGSNSQKEKKGTNTMHILHSNDLFWVKFWVKSIINSLKYRISSNIS